MNSEFSTSKRLRAAIIDQTKQFLFGLETGVSDEQLLSTLSEIKEVELQLIKEENTMLDPAMWKLLQSLFVNRRNKGASYSVGILYPPKCYISQPSFLALEPPVIRVYMIVLEFKAVVGCRPKLMP
jgi:hypothetical protein